jgi:DNA-directed RNA polymerase specialized sigma24 family protein
MVAVLDRQVLKAALRLLPIRQRTAVVLKHFEGLDIAEIATAMGITESSVGSAPSRGKDSCANTYG